MGFYARSKGLTKQGRKPVDHDLTVGVQDDDDIGRDLLGALLPRCDEAAALREAHHLRDRHVLRQPRF